MGKGVEGSFMMGDICIHFADLLHYIAENNTIFFFSGACKFIIFF